MVEPLTQEPSGPGTTSTFEADALASSVTLAPTGVDSDGGTQAGEVIQRGCLAWFGRKFMGNLVRKSWETLGNSRKT